MVWVKICGIRDPATAAAVSQLRPDAIGLNFYSGSRRYVDPVRAAQIAEACDPSIARIGVFVNATTREIVDCVSRCQLHGLQFHGDESSAAMREVAQELPETEVYRAYRMANSIADLAGRIHDWMGSGLNLAGCLVDSHVEGIYGGSGKTVAWDVLAAGYDRQHWPRLILAGGLTPENVATAVVTVRPWGVDVASGVEAADGSKDLDRVARFIAAARQTSLT